MIILAFLFLFSTTIVAHRGSRYNNTVVVIHGILQDGFLLKPLGDCLKKHCNSRLNVVYLSNYPYLESLREPMWKQVRSYGRSVLNVCKKYWKENPNGDGITLLGYSQGGLLAQAITKVFDNHCIKTLISLQAPLNGVDFASPFKFEFNIVKFVDIYLRLRRDFGIFTSIDDYFKAQTNQYTSSNEFIHNINCDSKKSNANATKYKNNFLKLKKGVFISSECDNLVYPTITEEWGFHTPEGVLTRMEDQEFYKTDCFGLQTLHKRNGLIRENVCEKHETGPYNCDLLRKLVVPHLSCNN